MCWKDHIARGRPIVLGASQAVTSTVPWRVPMATRPPAHPRLRQGHVLQACESSPCTLGPGPWWGPAKASPVSLLFRERPGPEALPPAQDGGGTARALESPECPGPPSCPSEFPFCRWQPWAWTVVRQPQGAGWGGLALASLTPRLLPWGSACLLSPCLSLREAAALTRPAHPLSNLSSAPPSPD